MRGFEERSGFRWLFCFAHPDDELAICAWISRLVARGDEVFMCWAHSTPVRELEARHSAKQLGVPTSNLRFLHGSDGKLHEELEDMERPFRKVIDTVCPDRVCCCAFEQGHLDHDATNFLISSTFEGPIFEIPLYHTYLSRYKRVNRFACSAGEEVLNLSEEEQRLKRTVALNYPSQPLRNKLLAYEILNCARLNPQHLARTERLRLQTHTNFILPNLPDELLHQVVASEKWNRWQSAVRRFRAEQLVFAVASDVARPSSPVELL
jgi:LmbE family N-acetylglucosaminyl deacetylase